MFTGIVKGLCSIVGIVDSEGMRQLQVAFEGQVTAEGLEIGASVAINGTCLTVTKFHQHEEGGHGVVVSFDCIQETLSRTNLGRLVLGDRVNVERAMRYGDEVGGHHVSGHIDCVGRISQIVASPNNREVFVQFPDSKSYRKFLFPKGWISIDGVSLTVVQVGEDFFSVSLIPETLSRTTLGRKGTGDAVNLEFDSNAKLTVLTIERILPDFLASHNKQ